MEGGDVAITGVEVAERAAAVEIRKREIQELKHSRPGRLATAGPVRRGQWTSAAGAMFCSSSAAMVGRLLSGTSSPAKRSAGSAPVFSRASRT